jgi:threonine dehydrogenase-like Zn-dependent dehydrogenase
MLLGAERVVVIDRYAERLRQVEDHIGAETLDYRSQDVLPELKEMTGGRGPDVCIEAVGMEAHSTGPAYLYDRSSSSCGYRPIDRRPSARPSRPAAKAVRCMCSASSEPWSTSSRSVR